MSADYVQDARDQDSPGYAAGVYCGDDMYGRQPVFLSEIKKGYRLGKDQLPIMKRFALYSKQLTFRINEEDEFVVEAPYPKDFATLIKL